MLMLVTGCEDPTLLIGARPSGEPEERGARDPRTRDDVTTRPDPELEADPAPELGEDAQVGQGVVERDDFALEPDAGKGQPFSRPDAAGFPMDVAGEVDRTGGGPPGGDGRGDDGNARGPIGDMGRPPPPVERPRYAYRCRADYECAQLRGVCDRGWCVQCRGWMDCPPYATCTPERVCVRRPPGAP